MLSELERPKPAMSAEEVGGVSVRVGAKGGSSKAVGKNDSREEVDGVTVENWRSSSSRGPDSKATGAGEGEGCVWRRANWGSTDQGAFPPLGSPCLAWIQQLQEAPARSAITWTSPLFLERV